MGWIGGWQLSRRFVSVGCEPAQHEGRFTHYVVVQDNTTQCNALDIYVKMRGAYAPKEEVIRETSTVRTIIMDVGNQRVSHSPDVATVKQLPPHAQSPTNGNK